ncbi:MAG: acyloxyacyl hydrolase [Phycisphaerales bacterium]|nr:acyloxyacyl hydrolase [Phycisphaerales bacterium]
MNTLPAAFLGAWLHATTPVVAVLDLHPPDAAAAVAPFTLALPQEPTPLATAAKSETSTDSIEDPPFAEGTRFFIPYLVATFGEPVGDIYTVHFGFGYFLEDTFSAALEPTLHFANAELGEDVIGGGLDLVFRLHFVSEPSWSLFIEGAAGFVFFDDDFPPGGTEFNFNFYFGLGVTYQLDSHTHLVAGARFYHISNARLNGLQHNIGFDSGAAYVGLMFPF